MPYIHSAGPIGIGFSLVVVVIAALNQTSEERRRFRCGMSSSVTRG